MTAYIVNDIGSGLYVAGSSIKPLSQLENGRTIHPLMSNRAGTTGFVYAIETENTARETQMLINTLNAVSKALGDDEIMLTLNKHRAFVGETRINTEAAAALVEWVIGDLEGILEHETLTRAVYLHTKKLLRKAKSLRTKFN